MDPDQLAYKKAVDPDQLAYEKPADQDPQLSTLLALQLIL